MPTNDDEDDGYRKALLAVVRDFSEQLGNVREQMSRDLADYLARYREDVHRSIMALNYRQADLEKLIAAMRTEGTRRGWLILGALGLLIIVVVLVVR